MPSCKPGPCQWARPLLLALPLALLLLALFYSTSQAASSLPDAQSRSDDFLALQPTAIEQTATITGTLLNDVGDPVWPANVRVCAEDDVDHCLGEYTALPGQFTGEWEITEELSGTYYLYFWDMAGAYGPAYHDNQPRAYQADPITIAPGDVITNITTTLYPGAFISGTVFTRDGTGLGNVQVMTCEATQRDACHYLDHVTSTQDDGTYTLGPLSTGGVLLEFWYNGIDGYIPTWYGGADISNAQVITVTPGSQATANVIMYHELDGIVQGYVRDSANNPIANTTVSFCNDIADFCSADDYDAITDQNGYYLAPVVQIGTTYALATPPTEDQMPRYYVNAISASEALSFTLAPGVTQTIDFVLPDAAHIQGTVKLAGSGPKNNALVSACAGDETTFCNTIAWDQTDNTGAFGIGGLNAGSYYLMLQFDTTTLYYPDADTLEDATAVTVVAGQTLAAKDFFVTPSGGGIWGRITDPSGNPVPDARVEVYFCPEPEPLRFYLCDVHAYADSDADGYYVASIANAAEYFIQASALEHPTEYYDNVAVIQEATPVDLGTATLVRKDFQFQEQATISGFVTGAGNAPLEGVIISGCWAPFSTNICTSTSTTASLADGSYTLPNLFPGEYVFEFWDMSGSGEATYYGGATIGSATHLTLVAGEDRTGIDVQFGGGTTTPTATVTPTTTVTATPSVTPSVTPSATPTETPSVTPSETPSVTPTSSVTPTPTNTPTPPPTVIATLEIAPDATATLAVDENDGLQAGQSMGIEVPTGTVTGSISLSLGLLAQPPVSPPQFALGGFIFTLEASQGGNPLESVTFLIPITLTITYLDSDIGGMDEATLSLRYYDETTQTWLDDGITVVSRDPANNRLVVTIAHLTTFGVFDSSERSLLPVISGNALAQ